MPYDLERDIFTCPACMKRMSGGDRNHHRCKSLQKGARNANKVIDVKRRAKLRAEADAARLSAIAFKHVVLRETYEQIGESLELTAQQIEQITRRPAYRKIRDELIANIDDRQKQVFSHVQGMLSDAELLAAKRIHDILEIRPDEESKALATVAKLATDVVRMRGHEAPKKTEARLEVSLSSESIRLLQQASAETAKIDAIDLDESDWSYAMSETRGEDETKKIAPPEALAIPEVE